MNKYVKLGDLIKSISKTHKFNKEELIFLNTSDVLEGKILVDTYMPVSEMKGQAKKTIQNGDILYSEIRPKNKRYAYVKNVHNIEDYVVSTKLMVLRNDSELLNTDYLYYFLTSDEAINYLQNRAENRIGSFPQITFEIIQSLNIWLPSLPTQQKIAAVLSALDDKIELNNTINAELEAMAKTLYDYWFVQFEFPNSEGKPYKSSGGAMEYNTILKREIPKGWEVEKFNFLVNKISDTIDSEEHKNLPYLPIDKIPKKSFLYSEYENRDNALSSLIKFNEDDILLGAMRVYFHRVCLALESGISRSTIFVLRAKNDIYKFYSLMLLNKEESIQFANDNSTGSSIPYAKWDNGLAELNCIIPTNDLLKAFNDFLKPIFDKVKNVSKQNQELAQLRDWLLPMLMNGQVKVVDEQYNTVNNVVSMAAESEVDYNKGSQALV